MGVLECLLVLFIALKLTGVITWPWLVVLLPLLPDAIIYGLMAILGVGLFRRHKREAREFDESFERMNWPRL